MRHAVVLVVFCGSSLLLGQVDDQLGPPANASVCQIAYGGAESPGTVRLAWTNPEMYGAVEFSIDDVPVVDAGGDGAAGRMDLSATRGTHNFGVRGVLDGRLSTWTFTEFTVVETSPIPEPVVDLDCEYVPSMGGLLRLSWQPGSDAWISGTLELTDNGSVVEFVAEGLENDVLTVVPNSRATSDSLEQEGLVVLLFKNDEGYASPPFQPSCVRRTPDFRRADCDADSDVDITDPIFFLNFLFSGGPRGFCDDACDSNDDGSLNVADALLTLNYLFTSGTIPPEPGPQTCGPDRRDDLLGGICTCL